MTESLEVLKKKVQAQTDIIKGYEKVLKLNEKELANAEQIIKMYESIIDYSSIERKDYQETLEASQIVESFSREELMEAFRKIREELMEAFRKIKELEEANKKLREETLNLNFSNE